MKCPIRFGKLNKWHLCIIVTTIVNLINSLISGISLSIDNPDKKKFLFVYKPIFNKHPFIKLLYSFLGTFIIGLILYIIKRNEEKKINEEEGLLGSKKEIKDSVSSLANEKLIKKKYHLESLKENIFTILTILIFSFAYISLNTYDGLGFNGLKLWPLEYLIIYIFLKKILKREFYKHQNLAIILILIFCNIGNLIVSFLPDEKSVCRKGEDYDYDICLLNNTNTYGKVIQKLSSIFIPVIMILYLISMTANSYGMVKIKYLIDFKFIELYKILMTLGISGFFISMILIIIFNYIPCGNDGNSYNVKYICKLTFKGKLYFESFSKYFYSLINGKEGEEGEEGNIFLEILFALIFLVINSLYSLFSFLIIKNLDPFYIIPIRSPYYLIDRTIKFIATSESSAFLTTKYILREITNTFAIICALIYLEIIILNFNGYEKNIRESIVDRERFDIEEANKKEEDQSKKIEIEINENYIVEI